MRRLDLIICRVPSASKITPYRQHAVHSEEELISAYSECTVVGAGDIEIKNKRERVGRFGRMALKHVKYPV